MPDLSELNLPVRDATTGQIQYQTFSIKDAGKVMLTPRGAYDATVEYEELDMVSYNGGSYVALTTTIGNLPTNTNYWMVLAETAVDSSLDSTSTNAIQNAAVANAINALSTGKQNTLTFDTTPTSGSTNPVTSGGVKSAIDNIPTSDPTVANDAMNLLKSVNVFNTFVFDESLRWGDKVISGVTFSYGRTSGGVNYISTSGTATANIDLIIGYAYISPGYFWLSGCPSGGSSSTYRLRMDLNDNAAYSGTYAQDVGNGDWGRFLVSNYSYPTGNRSKVSVHLKISSGTNMNNKEFYTSVVPTATQANSSTAPTDKEHPINGKEYGNAETVEFKRITQNTNNAGDLNKAIFQEFTPGSGRNLPDDVGTYHIITLRSATAVSQIAMGVISSNQIYYRRCNNGVWDDWIRLNSNTVSTLTGTNQGSITTSITGGTGYNEAIGTLLNNDATLKRSVDQNHNGIDSLDSWMSVIRSANKKSTSQSGITISGQNYKDVTLSASETSFYLIKGYLVSSSPYVIPIQLYFDGTNIKARLINYISSQQTCSFTVYYI